MLVRDFLLFSSSALATTVPATGAGSVGRVDVKIVKHWNRAPGKVFAPPLLEDLKIKRQVKICWQ